MKNFAFLFFLIVTVAVLFSSCKTESAFYVSYEMASHDRNARIEPGSLKCEMDSIVVEFTPKKGFIIRNNSDYAMIIDLYNSTNALDGVAERFSNCETTTVYTTNTSTTSHSRGATTNLGGIAKALGVGGALGTAASSVNVGGGNTNANTSSTTQAVTRTEERYIVIAPHAYKALGHKVGDHSYSVEELGPWFAGKEGHYYYFRPKSLLENYTSTEKTFVEIMDDDRTEMDLTLCYGYENENDFHYKNMVVFSTSVYYQKEGEADTGKLGRFRIPQKKNMIKFLYDPRLYGGTNANAEYMHWYVGF